jgi:hypothetical protein
MLNQLGTGTTLRFYQGYIEKVLIFKRESDKDISSESKHSLDEDAVTAIK